MDRLLKNSLPTEMKINGGVLNVVRQDIMLRVAVEIQLGNNLISLLLSSAQNANEENTGPICRSKREAEGNPIHHQGNGWRGQPQALKQVGQSALFQPTPIIHFKI